MDPHDGAGTQAQLVPASRPGTTNRQLAGTPGVPTPAALAGV